jgi:hypothetical protein
MVQNIDLLTSREARLHELGEYNSSAETSNELERRLEKVAGSTRVHIQ